MYARTDSTSSRIRAAFSGRLSSSTSSSGEDQDSPQSNVFAPLEEVWEALDEWFLLLLNEMEDIEGEAGIDECVLSDGGFYSSKGVISDVRVKSPVTRHLSETLHTTQRHSLSYKPDDLTNHDQRCSLSRSVSASGRLGGELSRNVAAALVPYRVQSIRQKLLRMGSDATFRLSQPAIEMNLANVNNGGISPGSPSEGTMFSFPALTDVTSRRNSSRRSISSINSPTTTEPQIFPTNRTVFPERDSHAGPHPTRDTHARRDVHAEQDSRGERDSNARRDTNPSQDTRSERDNHARRDVNAGQDTRLDLEQCDPRLDARTVSPAFSSVDSDVITMTADRLCVITHGFYLCCCNQSRWERR